jgi:hypothetical protein
MAILVNNEDVGLKIPDIGNEIHQSLPLLTIALWTHDSALRDVDAFILGVDCFPAFQVADGMVGAYPYVEVAILRGFLEEGYVAGVEHVETTGNEYFLSIFRH